MSYLKWDIQFYILQDSLVFLCPKRGVVCSKWSHFVGPSLSSWLSPMSSPLPAFPLLYAPVSFGYLLLLLLCATSKLFMVSISMSVSWCAQSIAIISFHLLSSVMSCLSLVTRSLSYGLWPEHYLCILQNWSFTKFIKAQRWLILLKQCEHIFVCFLYLLGQNSEIWAKELGGTLTQVASCGFRTTNTHTHTKALMGKPR